jgi:serralysin
MALFGHQTPSGIKFLNVLSNGSDYWQALLGYDEYQYGASGNDTMIGAGGNDTLAGGADHDLIYGYGGVDDLFGDSGNDTLLSGYEANKFPIIGVANAVFDQGGSLSGGTGDDKLYVEVFTNGLLTVDGGGDTDWVNFYSANTWQNGVPASLPTNLLDLESGIGETALGGSLSVTNVENILGGAYRDEFYGDDRANILRSLNNDDVLEGRGGADTLDGGTGHDVAQYTSAPSAVEVDLSLATQRMTIVRAGVTLSNGDAAGDVLTSIEELRGSDYDDIFRGRTGNFAETLMGDAGNDILEGRGGGDTLDGSTGFDFASYESSAGRVDVSLLPVTGLNGVQLNDATGDTLISIEGLIGSVFNDNLTGDNADNELRGGNGGDALSGLGGNDTLKGGAGNDIFYGGSGRDTMSGDAGDDTFNFLSVLDSRGAYSLRDVILDFERHAILTTVGSRGNPGDKIDLSAIDADQRASSAGDQAFTFVGSGPVTGAGQVRVIQTTDAEGQTYSLVRGEVNGDGVSDFEISVYTTDDMPLGASDFLL